MDEVFARETGNVWARTAYIFALDDGRLHALFGKGPADEFTLERIPPSDCRVAINDDDPGGARILSPLIQVNAGETAEVQLGGVGRAIIGKLVAPAEVEIRSWTNQVSFAQLHVEWSDYHVPENLTARAEERWRLEFEDTETGRAWLREQYSYGFKVNADGSFIIPEVLPGKYRLFVNVGRGYLGSGPDKTTSNQPFAPRVAATAARVTVPEDSVENASPLDLGEVLLMADH